MTQGHCFQGPHVQLLSATLRAPMGAAWKGSSIIHHFWGQNGVRERMLLELEQKQPWHSWDLGQEPFTGVTSDASMAAEAARNLSPAFLQRGQASRGTCHQPGTAGVPRSGSALTPCACPDFLGMSHSPTPPWRQESSRAGDPLHPYKSLLQLFFQSFARAWTALQAWAGGVGVSVQGRSWIP